MKIQLFQCETMEFVRDFQRVNGVGVFQKYNLTVVNSVFKKIDQVISNAPIPKGLNMIKVRINNLDEPRRGSIG